MLSIFDKGEFMAQSVIVEIEMPDELEQLKLPDGVERRLQSLLDRQDDGEVLSQEERMEAEGLVNLAELLSLLKLRSESAVL